MREPKIRSMKTNSRKADTMADRSPRRNRVFSADDKVNHRRDIANHKAHKKIKLKAKSTVLNSMKKKVYKVNNSTLDVFSTVDKVKRMKKFNLKIKSKSSGHKRRRIKARSKNVADRPTKNMNILNIQTGQPMSPSPEESNSPIKTDDRLYPNPPENNVNQNEMSSTMQASQLEQDSNVKGLTNPKEVPLRMNTKGSARRSEVVKPPNKNPKGIQRLQSNASVVNNQPPKPQELKKDSRNSSVNYNPISRQTTYRGDSFGNKEGLHKGSTLKKEKSGKKRKEDNKRAGDNALGVPTEQRNMKSVIREEAEPDINESSTSEKYTDPEESQEDESHSKSLIESVSDIRSRNQDNSLSPSLKSNEKQKKCIKMDNEESKSRHDTHTTPDLKSNINFEEEKSSQSKAKEYSENVSESKSHAVSELKSQAVSDSEKSKEKSIKKPEEKTPEEIAEEVKNKKKSLMLENLLHKTQIVQNNYLDSNSNISLNQSNINESKLTKYSDLKMNKSKLAAGNRRSSHATKIKDRPAVVDTSKTLSKMMTEKIVEEDCSPLKDKTTFNTPSEIISNVGGKENNQNISQKTIQTNKHLKTNKNPSVIHQKRNTLNHQTIPKFKKDDDDISTKYFFN